MDWVVVENLTPRGQITSVTSNGNARFETERIFKVPRSDLLNVRLADFAEADFWFGTVSGLLVKRKCTPRRASPELRTIQHWAKDTHVFVVTDACGGVSVESHDMAVRRMFRPVWYQSTGHVD